MRKLILALLILVVLAAALGVLYLAMGNRALARFDGEVARIAESGAPVSPADLEQAAVPPGQNAAVKFREAFAWLADGNYPPEGPGYSRSIARNALLVPDQALEDPEMAERVLAHLRPYLELLDEGLARPRVDWEIDWSDPFQEGGHPIPGLLEMRKAVNALVSRAVHAARTEAGAAESAQAAAQALRFANLLDGNVLLSGMIRLACRAIAVSGVRRIVGQPGFDARLQREALDGLLVQASDLAEMHAIFEGERVLSIGLWRLHGGGALTRVDGVAFLEAMQALIDTCRAPFHEVEVEVDALEASAAELPWYCPITRDELPGIARVRRGFAEGRAHALRARVALALAAYGQEHGRWPEEAELAAMFEDGLPLDPLTGAAFVVEEQGDGGLLLPGEDEYHAWILPSSLLE